MSLIDDSRRLAASLAQAGRDRIALVVADVEEELLHAAQTLAAMIAIAMLASLSLAAIAAAIVVLFWDRSPIAALLGVATAFGLLAVLLAWRLVNALRAKPTLLAATLEELGADARWLQERA